MVHFRLSGKAADLRVTPPEGELATFERDGVEVTLEKELEPEDPAELARRQEDLKRENSLASFMTRAGYTFGRLETGNCLVVARTSRELSDEFYALLQAELFERPGEFHLNLMLDELPEPLILIFEDVYAELHGEAARLVQLLRWVFSTPGPASPLGAADLSLSLDQEHWCLAPRGLEDHDLEFVGDVRLDGPLADGVAELWRSGELIEPIAHQILHEAMDLRHENARSAFILAVVAAEVGVKQFAAGRSEPSEAWLLQEIQSPPLDKLLGSYLVSFTDKKTTDARTVPRALVTTLKAAIQKRNHLIHRGEPPPTEKELVGLLLTVHDLLYLLDWFAGNEWAFHRLSEDTQTAYQR
jgi:hypothetical protein